LSFNNVNLARQYICFSLVNRPNPIENVDI